MTDHSGSGNQGPSTDQDNQPVMDPTDNVMKLVEAANRRQDDLRNAESLRSREVADLRAEHAKEIREIESRRLDAIRQVDVAAAKTEADRALTAIQALATKAAIDAENIRTALNATAATIAKQTSDTVGEITTRIAALEKSNYEGQGRSKVADPQIESLVGEMRRLGSNQASSGGERRGGQQMWGYLVGGIGVVMTILSFMFSLARR